MSYPNAKLMNLEDGQKLLEAIDQHKAEKDGAYKDLTAGNALYLLSDRGDTDVAPYVFRKTGGAKNGYGREFLRKIVGGTVAWNQLVEHGNFDSTDNWIATRGTISVSNNECTYTLTELSSSTVGNRINKANVSFSENHKYLILYSINIPHASICSIECSNNGISANSYYKNITETGKYIEIAFIANSNASGSFTIGFGITNSSSYGYTVSDTIKFKNVQIFDLTAMFGSTIADAIYAMEQATAGSGVAWFRSLFPKAYYAYDSGSLQSVQAKEHRTVGKNLLPMTVERIKAINQGAWSENSITNNGVTFTIETDSDGNVIGISVNGTASGQAIFVVCSDMYTTGNFKLNGCPAGGAFTGSYSLQTRIDGVYRTSNYDIGTGVDITVNTILDKVLIVVADGYTIHKKFYPMLRFSSVFDAAFEPYKLKTYPLDSSLTLRGIPKWDSTNGLYYDGDEYKPDGSVKRKYGIVDLGTLNWSYDTAASQLNPRFNSATALSGAKASANLICNGYIRNDSPVSLTGVDKTIYIYSNKYIYVNDFSYTDAATFKTAMSGVYLVYELETPTTEQADPYRELEICSKYGTEEFIDAGVTATTPTRDVSVPVGTETFYPIDVVAYIEELTNPDHDMVADALIPSGKYFMVGNSLYKSTSQIQAGATIIPGSNCTAKTLAEALNELNT